MAGIGDYEKGKKFTLKSGNATPFKQMGSSPVKQAIGGGAGEAIDHWKKYKAAKAQDKAVEKLATDKNISRKAFDTKLAKITKTVDPHPKVGGGGGGGSKLPPYSTAKKELAKKISAKNIKVDKRALKEALKQSSKYDAAKKHLKSLSKKSKTPSTTIARTTKAFSATPKQLAKGVTAKGAGKVASRAIPVIGEALMTYDVLKEGVKRVAKGIKTRVPQTKLKGKNIKDTFKRVKKKKYI